ncbi:MAG: Fe2+-dependent dioxygenase [Parvularculaceae bacterium]
MLLQIANALDAPEVAAVRDALADDALWEDGANTAAGRARAAKNNLQSRAAAPAVKGALAKVRAALMANEVFKAAAQPAGFARMIASCYGPGMAYGAHVDAPYIDGARTDLSFTLFLSEPDDYDGGALVIDSPASEDSIKLPAGSVALYPSTYLHRVDEVTRGERLAVIGWATSRIRSAEHRAMLFELETALADLRAADAPAPVCDSLLNLRNNLLRAWGE